MLSAAAATSILSLSGTSAFAATDANAQALDSPGLLSGNSVQAPLEVPVNLCGNTVNAAALANPASGNDCASSSAPVEDGYGSDAHESHVTPAKPQGDEDSTGYGSDAQTAQSPGLLSGNSVQAPVEAPVEVCGDSVGGVAVASGAYGNTCEEAPQPQTPPTPVQTPGVDVPVASAPIPPAKPATPRAPAAHPPVAAKPTAPHERPQQVRAPRPVHEAPPRDHLAETGADGTLLGAAGASVALLLGGAVLYRRGTAASRR